ncbi:carbonic anhydrase family protein [Thiorhodovibrio frisius]|uniref:carbonic anhydrase family protein n=1 Tax=Thiorhodovibrio frisius TaxID=631362 RepID=UPI001CBCA6D8|nr:carbonic anhydrase family protein [Thiorhodovibrio frisius]
MPGATAGTAAKRLQPPLRALSQITSQRANASRLCECIDAAIDGSLATPSCFEGALWLVMKDPVTASTEQIAHFGKTMAYPNNRLIQITAWHPEPSMLLTLSMPGPPVACRTPLAESLLVAPCC